MKFYLKALRLSQRAMIPHKEARTEEYPLELIVSLGMTALDLKDACLCFIMSLCQRIDTY